MVCSRSAVADSLPIFDDSFLERFGCKVFALVGSVVMDGVTGTVEGLFKDIQSIKNLHFFLFTLLWFVEYCNYSTGTNCNTCI